MENGNSLDQLPYMKRKAWWKRTSLWVAVLGTAITIYLIFEEISAEKIALAISLLAAYLAKEGINDYKH